MLDITIVSTRGLRLEGGELQLIINGSQHLSFPLTQSFSDPYLTELHIESYFCKLKESELNLLCDASTIELRLSKGREYIEISTAELQLAARIIYNAIIDKTAYVKEILQMANNQEAEKFAKDKKDALIWMWIIGVILFVIGIFTVWWCWFADILMAGGYTSYYISKKNSILNNADIE